MKYQGKNDRFAALNAVPRFAHCCTKKGFIRRAFNYLPDNAGLPDETKEHLRDIFARLHDSASKMITTERPLFQLIARHAPEEDYRDLTRQRDRICDEIIGEMKEFMAIGVAPHAPGHKVMWDMAYVMQGCKSELRNLPPTRANTPQ